VFRQIYNNPELTVKEILDGILEESAEDNFKLTTIAFGLPVYYMIKNFGINIGLYVLIPVNQPDYISEKTLFYFSAGISYNIEW